MDLFQNNMNNNLFISSNNKENNYRINSDEKKKKFNFIEKKKNTIKSLNDVEGFLKDFHKLKNYINLYKILK